MSEKYDIPEDVVRRAGREDRDGKHFHMGPLEVVQLIQRADAALNGDSNDAEHDALLSIREYLANLFEGVAT